MAPSISQNPVNETMNSALGTWGGTIRNQVRPHAVEVRRGGKAEHYCQADSRSGGPIPQRCHAKLADQSREHNDDDQNDQRCHDLVANLSFLV